MSEHNVFPTEELNQRLSNVRSQMVEANVDGVVITIPENIYYLNEHEGSKFISNFFRLFD